MEKKNNLQDMFLNRLRQERQVVTVIMTNGFQMKSRITAFDQFVVVIEIRNEQQILYKHAISTIVPEKPIDLREEAL